MTLTYRIEESTLPTGIDPLAFRRTLARAMRYVEKVCDGQVRFRDLAAMSSVERLKNGFGDKSLRIGFDDMLPLSAAASQMQRNGVTSIGFNPGFGWALKWWQQWFSHRQDLYTVAVHELGHLLGLKHNMEEDSESVMCPTPVVSTFDNFETAQLLQLTKPQQPCAV